MSEREVVMGYLVQDLETILIDERYECFKYIHDTFPAIKGTADCTEKEEMELKRIQEEMDLCTSSLEWLTMDGIATEWTLRLLKKNVHYYVADLGSSSEWYDYAVVGMMKSWILEYDETDSNAVEFNMKGEWAGCTVPYDVPKEEKVFKAEFKE